MFDLFKKKSKSEPVNEEKTASNPFEEITGEQIDSFIELLKTRTVRDSVEITLSDEPVGLFDSKLGGMPYIARNASVPEDSQGRQLRLLAQIRLSELPKNSPLSCLSIGGMLQFWALDDDTTGLDFNDGYIANNLNRVTYYDAIDEGVTIVECAARYSPWSGEDSYFPIDGEIKMSFTEKKDSISAQDHTFYDVAAGLWNEKFPHLKIENLVDLPDDINEKLYDEMNGFGHKIGGYPGFTQEDPRSSEGELSGYDVILLQIDSAGTDEHEIMWGDVGIVNFFIRPDDLKRGDFSKVLYTWDCC